MSRSDSSGVESPSDRLSARTGTYTRRENRLASLSKTDDNSASKDYKKLYEDALAENEKLKSRLDDSKLELTKIRSQLDRVAQKQDRLSERSTVFESEKREKEVLEKKVSDMEEELKPTMPPPCLLLAIALCISAVSEALQHLTAAVIHGDLVPATPGPNRIQHRDTARLLFSIPALDWGKEGQMVSGFAPRVVACSHTPIHTHYSRQYNMVWVI
ncbi:unnamed protein product [Leuciscus chuanchicus]